MNYRADEARAVLARTPRVLHAWLRGLDEPWIRADEGAGTFSAFDVVGHLVHGERTDWMVRTRVVLEHGTARAFDPYDRFAQRSAPADESLDDRLDAFAELRAQNLRDLDSLGLTAADLERRGTHPTLGDVTLGNLLATWVAHDLGHLAQIARVMAKRYTDDVGPWAQFLPVLER